MTIYGVWEQSRIPFSGAVYVESVMVEVIGGCIWEKVKQKESFKQSTQYHKTFWQWNGQNKMNLVKSFTVVVVFSAVWILIFVINFCIYT